MTITLPITPQDPERYVAFRLEGDANQACALCDQVTGHLLQIEVGHEPDQPPGVLAVCGRCVLEALAIAFGRAHVQHGGEVADLEVPPPAPGSAGRCGPILTPVDASRAAASDASHCQCGHELKPDGDGCTDPANCRCLERGCIPF